MERVQFQQEQMLLELKDLVQKGLFTQKEIKQIMQKRTMFETALIRRIPKKSDFLRYATYEMSLEGLRKKRAERLEMAKGPPSVSDFALVRRQFQIFERALKKFKGDVGLWLQYIQVAKKEGARSLVGRITARALQLHPNIPALYVLAASHELEHLSPTAARALLQRGLRLNADSVEMWREYVRMEMGFVESLRRRWSILGIETDRPEKGIGARKGKERDNQNGTDELWSGLGDHEEDEPVADMTADVEEVEEDEAARKKIMEGAIVRSTISSAIKALPKIELFVSLHELISAYPIPPVLRGSLLEHLHDQLRKTLPSVPSAIKLGATRHLTPEVVGEPLVDALRSANEELLAAVRNAVGETKLGVASVYAEFVEEWCRKILDDSLKAYLITSVYLLTRQLPAPVPPELLAAHVRLLVSHQGTLRPELLPPKANTPEKILRLSRRHTNKAPLSATVWLARLDAEKRFAEQDAVETAWAEARKNVKGDGIQDVWLWGLELQDRPSHSNPDASSAAGAEADVQLLEHLLHENQLMHEPAAAGALHEALLIRYAAASYRALLYRAQITRDAATIDRTPSRSPAHAPGHHDGAIGVVRAPHHRLRPHHGISDSPSRPSRPISAASSSIVDVRLTRVRRIGTAYRPTARVWRMVFEQESMGADKAETSAGNSADGRDGLGVGAVRGYSGDADGDERVLRSVYEFWRQADGVEATTAWATWLLEHGRTKEALAVVGRARSVLGETEGEMVERRWKGVLDRDGDDEEGAVEGGEDEGAGPEAE